MTAREFLKSLANGSSDILQLLLSILESTGPGSDLRIQLHTDPRFQAFLSTAETRLMLGYAMKVASLGNVLQGKVWAYLDDTRRRSKRQKDRADIARLTEAHPELFASLPVRVKDELA